MSTMQRVEIEQDFTAWRTAARRLVAQGVPPEEVFFDDGSDALLPGLTAQPEDQADGSAADFRVPRRFMELAEVAADARDEDRWHLLYRLLWRLKREGPGLMKN